VRRSRRIESVVVLAVSALASVLIAACGSSVRASRELAAPSIPTPLATSIQTAAGAWATVAMGRLDEPLNTFWQLLFRPSGSPSWSNQVKATAVATNGGLVLASPGGRGLLVGVRPTNLLTFSPLIYTANAGRSWSTGLLADGLAARPDALATDSASRMLALVNARAEAEVLESTGGPSRWRTLVGARALASTVAGRSCGLTTITAVGYMGETPLAAGSCSRPDVLGVFAVRAGSWQLLEGRTPSSLARDHSEVLALESSDGSIDALLGSSEGGAVSLFAAWYRDRHWNASQPLRVNASEQISSFGAMGGRGIFVLLTPSSGRARVAIANNPGASWRQLPPPPSGTATVAPGPGASIDALVVRETVLSVWTLAARSNDWVHAQTMNVPIEFGSSE